MPRQFGIPAEVIQEVLLKKQSPAVYDKYLQVLEKEHVIGVNMAYLFHCVDVLFYGDDSFFKSHKEQILAFQGLRVGCPNRPEAKYAIRVKALKRVKTNEGLTDRSNSVVWHSNSGGAAINLAYLFGAKQIILLGYDMDLDTNQNQHWHKEYHGNVTTIQGTFKRHKACFPSIASAAQKKGIEILNANPESKIPDFKKVNLSDIL